MCVARASRVSSVDRTVEGTDHADVRIEAGLKSKCNKLVGTFETDEPRLRKESVYFMFN